MNKQNSFFGFVVGAIFVVLLVGCSSEDPAPIVIVESPQQPFPDSEDQLMLNFRNAYEDMEAAEVLSLLHPDYVMFLQQSTIDQYPDLGPSLNVAAETRIVERMLSGEPLTNPAGELVPGVTAISIGQLEQQGTWQISLPTDVIPQTRFGLFNVVFHLERPGYSTMKVQGQLKFYVTSRDSVHDGVAKPYWQLIGMLDLTKDGWKKGSNEISWGAVKASFR